MKTESETGERRGFFIATVYATSPTPFTVLLSNNKQHKRHLYQEKQEMSSLYNVPIESVKRQDDKSD